MRNNFAVVGSGNWDDVPEQGKTYRSMAALPVGEARQTTPAPSREPPPLARHLNSAKV